MSSIPEPVARLIEEFSRLPGIGPKSASRLTFYLLRHSREQAEALAEAIVDLKDRIILCSVCFNVTEHDPCPLCSQPEPRADKDLRGGGAAGRAGAGAHRHLQGPVPRAARRDQPASRASRPDKLKIAELLRRVKLGDDRRGDPGDQPQHGGRGHRHVPRTAQLVPLGVRVTRLARGLPIGGDLEYADEVTLARALEGRREM